VLTVVAQRPADVVAGAHACSVVRMILIGMPFDVLRR